MKALLIASNVKDFSKSVEVGEVEITKCKDVDDKDSFIKCIVENFYEDVVSDLRPKQVALLKNYKYVGFDFGDKKVFPVANPLYEEEEEEGQDCTKELINCKARLKKLQEKYNSLLEKYVDLEHEFEALETRYETLLKKLKKYASMVDKDNSMLSFVKELSGALLEMEKTRMQKELEEKKLLVQHKAYQIVEEDAKTESVERMVSTLTKTMKDVLELFATTRKGKETKEVETEL